MANMTMTEADFLARRCGFEGRRQQPDLMGMTREQAVDHILSATPDTPDVPEWYDVAPPTREQRKSMRVRRQIRRMGIELKHWWYQHMTTTSSPLSESMTLFWHNHFTSSLKKVKWPPLLLGQNQLFREQGLENFGDLLRAMLRDPALLIYLDNASSRRQHPNENLARELLELFTLGEGNYEEQDIRELARALTGASVDRKTLTYRFRRFAHDSGYKTILGHRGRFTPDDVADIILAQPDCADFICTKLWHHFIDDSPDSSRISQLADEFLQNDYALKPLLRSLFLTEEFWRQATRPTQVKSPMDLLVGMQRAFYLPPLNSREFLQHSRALQQDLFDPPNVKGWAGGTRWYTTATLPARQSFISQQMENVREYGDFSGQPLTAATVLAVPAAQTLPETNTDDYLDLVFSDPAFQLK